jgi:hypothetical protein
VTIQGNHARCDHCGAVTPVESNWFETWETIGWQDGADAHLCDKCRAKRDRGWLAEDLVLECVRCERNSEDNRDLKWHVLPRVPADPNQARHVCDDCFRLDDRLSL